MDKSNSLVCHHCFKDKVIIELIRREGRGGWCAWCGGRNVYVIPLHELGDMFRDVVTIYQPGDINGDTLSFLLQEDWNIFSDQIEQASDDPMQDLTVAILKAGLSPKDYLSGDYPDYGDFFYRKEEWLVEHWQGKAEAYFLGGQQNQKEMVPPISNHLTPDDIPDLMEPVFEDLSRTYEPGHVFYRARIHKERFRDNRFDLSEVGAPPADDTPAGRANRNKEPVLYLASNDETALAEVRAWNGMAVAIARFEIRKPLSVVSLLNYQLPESPFFQEYLEWNIQLAALFDSLAEELSRPVLPDECENIYFSTQYLCDLVKRAGHDGIEYPSSMGKGVNIALFDPGCAAPLDIRYVRINEIRHQYDGLEPDESLYDEGPFDHLFQKQQEPKIG